MDKRITIFGFVCATLLVACSTNPNITGSLKLYHELDGQQFDVSGLQGSLDCSQLSAPIQTEPPPALARIATRQSSSSGLTISFSYPNFVIHSDGGVALSGTWEPLDDNTVLVTVDGDKQKVDIEIREDGVIIPILPEGLSLNPTCNPEPVTTPPDDGGEDPADDGDDNGGSSDPGELPPSDESDPGNPAGNSVTESVDGFTFGTVQESFYFVIDEEGAGVYVGMTDEEVCCNCDTPGVETNLVTIGGIPPEVGTYDSDVMVVRIGRVNANGDPIGAILDSESMSVTLSSLTEERATGNFSATFSGGQTVEGSFDAEVCPIESD